MTLTNRSGRITTSSPSTKRLLNYLPDLPRASNSELSELVGVDIRTIQKAIQALRDAGQIQVKHTVSPDGEERYRRIEVI